MKRQRASATYAAAKGLPEVPVDFLICSVALLRNWPIFTLDRDFARFSEHIQIRLLNAP